jgi:isopentenyl-diphosphate Delta-isomerase
MSTQLKTPPLDQVTLVNDQDEVIGVMDKLEAHRGDAKLHRAISVFLFNKKGEILMQQRSAKKIVGAHQWANTCCGNVWPGESYEACAQRRLRDELGITTATIRPVHKFKYFARCNDEFSEHEIDQVFVGEYEGEVNPNPDEVQMTKWIYLSDIQTELAADEAKANDKKTYAPWFHELMREEKKHSFLPI